MLLIVKPGKVGLGAFATAAIAKGEVIWDWSEHPLFAIPPQILPEHEFKEVSPGVFNGPLGPDKYPDTYLNHSCEPNATILFQRPKIHLIALRDIRKDEEVTFDYAALYSRPWSMKCLCGTPSCRKTIVGKP